MKKILITSEKFRIIICLLLMISCTKTKEDTPTPKPCNISGTSVYIGSTAGGTFPVVVGTALACPGYNVIESIYFENKALAFFVLSSPAACGFNSGVQRESMLDAGVQRCLDFTYSESGSFFEGQLSFKAGHGYVGKFKYGHIVKFIAKSYTNGVVNIEYILK